MFYFGLFSVEYNIVKVTVSGFIRNVLDYVFAGSRDFPESPLVAWQPHSDKKRRRDCVNDSSNVAVLFSDLKHSLRTLYVQFWAVQDERSQLWEICSGLQSRILVLYHSVSFSISDQINKVCFGFAVFWNHHMLADVVPTFGVSLSHNLTSKLMFEQSDTLRQRWNCRNALLHRVQRPYYRYVKGQLLYHFSWENLVCLPIWSH